MLKFFLKDFLIRKEIREYEKQENLESSKIFAFTANVFKEQLEEYYKSGFDSHFLKPFKKKDLQIFIYNEINSYSES